MMRFGQKDILRGNTYSSLSLNRYLYVQNDPVNFVDPSGNESVSAKIARLEKEQNRLVADIRGYKRTINAKRAEDNRKRKKYKSHLSSYFGGYKSDLSKYYRKIDESNARIKQIDKEISYYRGGFFEPRASKKSDTVNSINSFWENGQFDGFWWQDEGLVNEAIHMLEQEAKMKGGLYPFKESPSYSSKAQLLYLLSGSYSMEAGKTLSAFENNFHLLALDNNPLNLQSSDIEALYGRNRDNILNYNPGVCMVINGVTILGTAIAYNAATGKYSCSRVGGTGKTALNSVDDIISNPKNLYGKSKADVSKILGDGWTEGTYGSSKTGWKYTKGDQSIFYHPGGGVHGGSYYGYSSGSTGKIKIVGPDYVPITGDKATIINVN